MIPLLKVTFSFEFNLACIQQRFLTSHARLARKYSLHSSFSVYLSINALYPKNLPTRATAPCNTHGTHHLKGPNHHAVGKRISAVSLACLHLPISLGLPTRHPYGKQEAKKKPEQLTA